MVSIICKPLIFITEDFNSSKMASRRLEDQPIPTMVKKVFTGENVDSSDDEEYALSCESVDSHHWFCESCGTYISKPCYIDAEKKHFQLNKQTGEQLPVAIVVNGRTARLLIHNNNGVEFFCYIFDL